MVTLRKIIGIIIFIFFLAACSTTKNPVEQEEADAKIKTAKINAQLGIAYLEEKNIKRSKQKLLLAIKQAPNIPEPWYSMAYFLEATGNQEEANQYYLKAIEVAPTRGDAQNNYGTFLCRTAHYQAAVNHFLLAVKDPNYLTPADAYENAGVCAMRIKQYSEALEYFDKTLQEDPGRSSALMKIANIYFQIGKYQKSKEKLQEFLSISAPTSQSIELSVRLNKKLAQQTQSKENNTHQVKNIATTMGNTKKTKSIVKAHSIQPNPTLVLNKKLIGKKNGINAAVRN